MDGDASGAPQGCNTAVLLFVLASMPLLRLLQRAFRAFEVPRAAASPPCPRDGLVGAYYDIFRDGPRLRGAFTLIERTTGLKLKMRKCCLVPLAIGRRGIAEAIRVAKRTLTATPA